MTVAVSKAVEEGAETVIVASTGNTASSAAAYAARAGHLGRGAPAGRHGRLGQGRAVAHVRRARAPGATAASTRRSRPPASSRTAARFALVNSLNPYRREGQKTAVFEIVEELGGVPAAIYLPYGGGGNTTAYGQAFAEFGDQPSRLIACEAARPVGNASRRRSGSPSRCTPRRRRRRSSAPRVRS